MALLDAFLSDHARRNPEHAPLLGCLWLLRDCRGVIERVNHDAQTGIYQTRQEAKHGETF